jgi:enoyl-CoA hydratase
MARVSYQLNDSIATITLDDGKVNVMSPDMQAELHAALDQAESDRAVVVLSGRDGMLSAGFDLKVLASGGQAAASMVIGGFELAARMLAFPRPIVIACTGHAIAMGSFLLLSGDYRIGTTSPAKYTANEVAIGLTMPRAAIEILRQRLTPAAFVRASTLSEVFTSANAVAAGFLDEIVAPDELISAAHDAASRFALLDPTAYAATKLRARSGLLDALRQAIDEGTAELSARLRTSTTLPLTSSSQQGCPQSGYGGRGRVRQANRTAAIRQ